MNWEEEKKAKMSQLQSLTTEGGKNRFKTKRSAINFSVRFLSAVVSVSVMKFNFQKWITPRPFHKYVNAGLARSHYLVLPHSALLPIRIGLQQALTIIPPTQQHYHNSAASFGAKTFNPPKPEVEAHAHRGLLQAAASTNVPMH